MNRNIDAVKSELANLANDAQALLDATAGVAQDGVIEARARLTAALKQGERVWRRTRHTAFRTAHQADQVLREHPYHSLSIALGVGLIVGFLASRRF